MGALEGKEVLVGVTGGIAAYRAADLVSQLRQSGAAVTVLMTSAARAFVTPLTFRSLSWRPVVTNLFDEDEKAGVTHIELAQRADCLAVAPATANIIARLALGLAEDPVSTTALAVRCPMIVAPAMNDRMWEHPAVQGNMKILRDRGWEVVDPVEGEMACGAVGVGKLAPVDEILARIVSLCSGSGPAR